MTTSTAPVAGSNNGVLGRSARPPGQLWQVPVFLAGIVSLVLAAAAAPFAPGPEENPLAEELAALRQALDKPGPPSDASLSQAELAVGRASHDPEQAGEAHYLLGALCLRLAEHCTPDRAPQELGKASMHLELAELLKVPAADQQRLTYLRGKVAYLNGNLTLAVDLLKQALPGGADNAGEGYGFLVKALLRGAVPDVDGALDANRRQLEVCDDENMLTEARMLRGELCFKKEMWAEAIKALESIGPKTPPGVRLKARHMQAEAAMAAGLWGRAIPWWNELLAAKEEIVPGGKGRISYNLGICWMKIEPPAHYKEAAQAWREAQLSGGEEAQAAALRLAELQLAAGSDPAAALSHLKEALDKVFGPRDYKNSLVDLGKARELLESACRLFNEQQLTEPFVQAAQLYKKIALPGVADELIGRAAEASGRQLLNVQDDLAASRKAKDDFVMAALAYEQAAESTPPAGQADVLWRCYDCYRLAEKPLQAIGVLKKFVELNISKERKAEAWFALAEIQKQLSPPDAAESYKQCVLYNNPAFTSRALLQLARLALEDLDLLEAETELQHIKNPSEPIVDFQSHQTAMRMLATLFFQQHQYDKAVTECEEFLKRYPGHPDILGVREQLGDCYHFLAEQARANAARKDMPAEKQKYNRGVWLENLECKRKVFQQLADDLAGTAAERFTSGKVLSPTEQALRRKARLYVAYCYYDLQNYERSFELAHKLFEECRDQSDALPYALLACWQLHSCWAEVCKPPRASKETIDIIHEAAAAAVEYCLSHLDDYERAAIRPSPDSRATWQNRLNTWKNDLKQSSASGPG